MKALILAGGKSTRLYPLTISTPKCLLVVGGKTILDHQIEGLLSAGVSELVLVVGCHKEKIIDHLTSKKYPLSITYVENNEYETTQPIMGLFCAREHLVGPIIFSHCDALFSADAIKDLLADPHETALLYKKGVWDEEAGKIILDSGGRVRELGKHIEQERATGEYLQTAKFGVAFCKKLTEVLDERALSSRDGYTIDAFNDVVRDPAIEAFGVSFSGVAMEIDTPEDYSMAQKAWVNSN